MPASRSVPPSSTTTLVGQALGLDQQVGAHHDGAALGGHLPDEVEHGVRRLGVEAGGGLVEQQQLGVVQHRAGQREAGLHAGGVAADLLVEGLDDAEAVGGGDDAVVGVAAEAVELGGVARGCRGPTGGRRGRAWPTRRRSGGAPPRRPRSGSRPKVRTCPRRGRGRR